MIYRKHVIKTRQNSQMFSVYIDGLKQDSEFLVKENAIDYAKSSIRLGLFKIKAPKKPSKKINPVSILM